MSHGSMKKIRLLLTGGGTGGHLFPAIATAQEFQRCYPQTEVLFIGTHRKLDSESLIRYGFTARSITSSGIKGKNPVQLAKAVLALPVGYLQAIILLRNFRPDIVFGVGGYVTGPVIAAARTLAIPTVIHEQNSIAGLANRKLGRLASRICLSLPESAAGFPAEKVILTGNPVREAILRQAERAGVKEDRAKTVLVLGGSQGAHALNLLVPEAVARLSRSHGVKVIHQTGRGDTASVRQAYHASGTEAVVEDFFADMASVYAQADLVVSRAGATTLAELAVLGKPAILVPYPFAADNHQERNGEFYVNGGGAVLMREVDVDAVTLAASLDGLLTDSSRLAKMGAAMKSLAFPNAAGAIVEVCRELIGEGECG